jgi:hypothetical protein
MANWINNGDSGSTIRAKLNTIPNNGSSFIGSPSGSSGRLTLSSGVPVMTSTVAGATTVYFTPYKGNAVPVTTDSGSTYPLTTFSQLSQTTTDATKSPAAVAASSVYDMFVWYDSGTTTLRCTRGPAWSSGTSRGTGAGTSELQLVNGYYVNKNAITNGPGANLGTYVGSIASNASSTIDWIIGGSGSGGVAGFLGVWNNYNRLSAVATTTDSGATYTYSTNTPRQARASAGNQISFVCGLAEDSVSGVVQAATSSTSTGASVHGAALDVTNTFAAGAAATWRARVTSNANPSLPVYQIPGIVPPQLGLHFISRNEQGDGTLVVTMNNSLTDALTIMLPM